MVIDSLTDLGLFLEIEYDLKKDNITKEEGEYYKKYLISILKKHKIFSSDLKPVKIGYVELYLKKYNIKAYKLGIYQE